MILTNLQTAITDEIVDILGFLGNRFVTCPNMRYQEHQHPELQLVSYKLLSEYAEITSNSLKRELAQNRRHYELICVEPKSAGLASLAARDGRVDLIRITPKSSLSIFNKRFARRLFENNKIVELDISFIFNQHFASELRPVLRILKTFEKVELRFSLTNLPTASYELRSYRGLQAIGREFGLTNGKTDPMHLINRIKTNNKKLKGIIPVPGTELIEW